MRNGIYFIFQLGPRYLKIYYTGRRYLSNSCHARNGNTDTCYLPYIIRFFKKFTENIFSVTFTQRKNVNSNFSYVPIRISKRVVYLKALLRIFDKFSPFSPSSTFVRREHISVTEKLKLFWFVSTTSVGRRFVTINVKIITSSKLASNRIRNYLRSYSRPDNRVTSKSIIVISKTRHYVIFQRHSAI